MKASVLNCPIDLYDIDYVVNASDSAINDNKNLHIVTLNPEMITYAQKNREFLEILNKSDLNIIDGVGVKIALKLQGINPVHIRGIDLSRALIKLCSEKNYKLGFIGAKEDVIQKAKQNCLTKYENLNFVFVNNGYFDSDEEIIAKIKTSAPQVLLVGLGSPKQEQFIIKLKKEITGCVFIGVGGSFDVFSGIVSEAPVIYRKLGLEWLYRTILDPKRFKRIFPTLPLFLIKCIIDTITTKDQQN